MGVVMALALALDAAAAEQALVAAEAAPAAAIAQIAGVYKHRFKNGIIAPGKAPMEADTPYESEDIVEIVAVDPTHVYIRAELQFYNGHSCSISGVAGAEGKAFVYHDPAPDYDGSLCTLQLTATADGVEMTDRVGPGSGSSCSRYCGTRGGLTRAIPKAEKRPIRYMALLKNSAQYKKAVAAMRAP